MKKIISMMIVTSFIITSLTGCGSSGSSGSSESSNNTSNSTSNNSNNTNNTTSTFESVAQVSTNDLFTDRDYATGFDDSDYATIDLSSSSCDSSNVTIDGNIFTITTEGTYLVKGSMSDGQIVVDVSNTEKVQLMLDGVSLSNSSTAPIYVKSADKVFITTASGSTNTLDATLVKDESASTNIDAVIFSHDDITLNGEGTLTIKSTANGIVGKDDLKITSGTYNITADNHGIEANNSIRIGGGTYNITAEKDGFHCEYADDTSKGYIYVLDGKFNLDVEGDGLDASSYIELVTGDYNITTGGGWANAPVKVAEQNAGGGGMVRRAITTTPIVNGISIIANDFISSGMMGGQGGQQGGMGQGDQMMGGQQGQMGVPDETLILDMLENQPEQLYAMVAMFTDMTADEISALSQDEIIALVTELLASDQAMMGGQPGGQMQGGMMPGGDMAQDGMMPGGDMAQGGMMPGDMAQGGMMPGGDMAQGGRGEMMQGEMSEEMMAEREQMMGDRENMMQGGQMGGQMGAVTTTTDDTDDGVSRKAIKAGGNITIQSGTFDLDSYDDAVHADGNLLIRGGDFTIGTSDDALHADYNLTVEDGRFIMVNCHEGVEGQSIDIKGGYMDITCNDDGFNAASSNSGDIYINIEGGEIYIDGILECDGFDSNGNLYMSGGYVQISGTTETRDTVLDYQNTGYITGGSFIATGSASQTLQNFGSDSTQGSIVVTLSSFQSGKVTLTDSKGNVIVDITPPKEYQAVTISTPDIVVGETYTLVSGNITTEIEMTSLLYGSGNQSSGRR